MGPVYGFSKAATHNLPMTSLNKSSMENKMGRSLQPNVHTENMDGGTISISQMDGTQYDEGSSDLNRTNSKVMENDVNFRDPNVQGNQGDQ